MRLCPFLHGDEVVMRGAYDALQQLTSYLTSPAVPLSPSTTDEIPPHLQPLFDHLQARLTTLQSENDRLRSLNTSPSSQQKKLEALEVENRLLAEALSTGRVAALEATLAQVDSGARKTIARLEKDADDLVALGKRLKGKLAQAKKAPPTLVIATAITKPSPPVFEARPETSSTARRRSPSPMSGIGRVRLLKA